MIAFARMNRILEIDLDNERAVVQPGVVNLDITLAVQEPAISTRPILPASAPAPSAAMSRRMPAVRTRWLTASPPITCSGLEIVLPDGTIVETGGKEPDLPGLRSDRPADRLGRHHGAGHQSDRAADAHSRSS